MSVLPFIRLNILAIFTGHELQTRAIKGKRIKCVLFRLKNIAVLQSEKFKKEEYWEISIGL
jgi:hypothetical protein